MKARFEGWRPRFPWTIGRIRRNLAVSSAITSNNTGAGGRETDCAPACNSEERDMWTTLFSLTLTAAICFGVAAIVLPHVKYLARFSG